MAARAWPARLTPVAGTRRVDGSIASGQRAQADTPVMGAWSAAIHGNDRAADIRGTYLEHLEDQLSDDEALDRVLDEYAFLEGTDDEHELWLSLALTQSKLGRLDDEVRDRALEIIDSGDDLDRWADLDGDVGERRRALMKLRVRLTSPQPARSRVRRPWRYATKLEAGDLLLHDRPDGGVTPVLVLDVDREARRGDVVQVAVLRTVAPDALLDVLLDLPLAPHPQTGRPDVRELHRERKEDPAWQGIGLRRARGGVVRPQDDELPPPRSDLTLRSTWEDLGADLASGASAPPWVPPQQTRPTGPAQPLGQTEAAAAGSPGANGWSIASLVVGILAIITSAGVVTGIVLGPVAVVLGVLGRREGNRTGRGRGMAVVGMVFGVIVFVVDLLLLAAFVAVGLSGNG